MSTGQLLLLTGPLNHYFPSIFIEYMPCKHLSKCSSEPFEGGIKQKLGTWCFLKLHLIESQLAVWFDADNNTARKYVCLMVKAIAKLHHYVLRTNLLDMYQ